MGRRAFVVTGRRRMHVDRLRDQLANHGIELVTFQINGEPSTETARDGVRQAREASCDLIIGLGGGSALDAGKAIAALLTNEGDPYDYLEVIGKGKRLAKPSVPYIAIPTTAGTGSEVTNNAVLTSPEHHTKVSLRSPLMFPRLALVDPELTYSLPPETTASTGLDALTQLIEAYVSIRANPLTDAICREGIRRAARSLEHAWEDGNDAVAREDISVASLMGGLALANAGLGAAHGFAGPIGGMFSAPHGAICACLLPHVIAVNTAALKERLPAGESLRRYHEVSRILTGNESAGPDSAATWVKDLCKTLRIPSLASYGLSSGHIPLLIEKAAVASSMKNNPIQLTPDEMREILTRAL